MGSSARSTGGSNRDWGGGSHEAGVVVEMVVEMVVSGGAEPPGLVGSSGIVYLAAPIGRCPVQGWMPRSSPSLASLEGK